MITPRSNVSVAGVILLIFLSFHPVASLQVTSGSPCASACGSSPHIGTGSSYELVCKDDDFLSTNTGQWYQSCLTCLQESSFSKDDETDQQWFLYHLRSLFNSCIFDHLDDQGSALESCVEDDACEGLDVIVKTGTNDPTSKTPDGYCGVKGSTNLSHSVETCLKCVQSSNSHKYLSNFLVAVQTGCESKPSPGNLLGLGGSVFGESLIQNADQSSSDNSNLKPGAIAGIAIGIVAFLLLVSYCVFFFFKRRPQRSPSPNRSSLLSFRCQTRVTPRTPRFPPELVAQQREMIQHQREYIDPGAALNSNPVNSRWHAPSNWYTTPRHTPSSSTTALVSPPPTAYFAPNLMRSPEQEHHSRSASSSISSISSCSVSSRDPLIRPRTDSAEPPEYSSIDNRPPPGFIPGLAISTPGDTALYTGQNVVQKSLYTGQRGHSYQPWGSRRGRYKDTATAAGNQPTGDDLEDEKSSPLILPSEFSPFQVSQPPPPARKP